MTLLSTWMTLSVFSIRIQVHVLYITISRSLVSLSVLIIPPPNLKFIMKYKP